WIPLHRAADKGSAETVTALVRAGAEVNARDENGWTPLHRAARRGNPKTVAALVRAGADVKARNNRRTIKRRIDPPRTLLEIGGELLGLREGKYRVDRYEGGMTPLHLAVQNGHAEAVTALVRAGAKVNARDGEGQTLLHWAVAYGTAETVTALIGAGADPMARDNKGKLPADMANDQVKDHDIFRALNAARRE
ncbi:MAG: ankyrin repeat domain-containing protein, partial [Hyphomonadaceae bacterium]|nr:ankyrin repeat domain-containing protein [Hyphomonadaceae bacterium]